MRCTRLAGACFLTLAAWSLSQSLVPAHGADAARRPNILVIVADDLGYADVGFHGCQDIPTPHVDALAKSGVRCTNGYVSGPYCSPTRAGLLTGRHQVRFGHEFNTGGPGGGLPVEQVTLADLLHGAGYKTGLVGKWHLGAAAHFHPQRRGFDEFFGFLGGAHPYLSAEQGAPILRGSEAVDEQEYLTDAFAREAVAFIDQHQHEPFFLYLAFNAVHTPLQANAARLKKFASIEDPKRQKYAAMLSAMDDAVGRVTDKLKTTELVEKTLVFFFSDNGGPTMPGTTINGSKNTPLRGSKRTTLEGGVRVPFVVTWPGKLAPRVYNQPVVQLDVLPTVLAAASVTAPAQVKLDGVNLIPYLNGELGPKTPHETLYWRFGAQRAIRHGDWKLVAYDPAADTDATTPKTGAGEATAWKLYNLADDEGERRDRSADQPEKFQELAAAWDTWNHELPPVAGGGAAKNNAKRKAE